MSRRLLRFAALAVALYALLTVGAYSCQRMMFYRTQAQYQTPAQLHLAGTVEIALTAADGVHVIAWYSPAPSGAPTLVFFHGNGGGISMRHWRIRRGQKMGYGVFVIEYRGFSGREGTPTEEGLYADARA